MSSVDDFMKYSSVLFNDNIFFCEGVRGILAKPKNETYLFIQFEAFLLKKILSTDLSTYSGMRFILISDAVMMPLALYLMKTCSNIEAVFEKKTRIPRILQVINNRAEKREMAKEMKRNYCILTEREFVLLKTCFHINHSVSCQATMLGVREKTVYGYRCSIAKKMGIKKIAYLAYLLVRS